MNTRVLRLVTGSLALAISVNTFVLASASGKGPKPLSESGNAKNAKSSNDKNRKGRDGQARDVQPKSNSKKNAPETIAKRIDSRSSSKAAKKNANRETALRETNLAKKQRAAELRRAEEKRRAEAARLAAIARQRARDEALREHVRSLIAKDDLSGEDPEVRRVALSALGDHAGTVVVMNPQTGRIYSIVNQQWALREGFKPCSTIKLVTTVAGLNENVIAANDAMKVSDTNQTSLTSALAYSKNHFFQIVGEELGFEKMVAYSRRLGLGEKTGINARNEFQGRVPGAQSINAIRRMSSHGDHYEVTPVQLATLVSAIGNGGKLVTPYIVRTRQDEAKFKTRVRRRVNVDGDVWDHVIPGMVGAVNYGSGKRAYNSTQQVAGKTGTCIEDGSWVGLFTSYAPVSNPKLAVVVVTRGPDARSHFPAMVAGRIYRDLGHGYASPSLLPVASTRRQEAFDNREADDRDNEEETAAEEAEYKVQTATVFRADRANPGRVKPVLMSIPVPRHIEKAPASSNDEPSTIGGQTRPRRVLGE